MYAMFKPIFLFFSCSASTRSRVMTSSYAASRWHALDIPHSVGLLWMSDRNVAEPCTLPLKTHKETDIRVSDGILTDNLSKRAAADPGLRPRGYWDRRLSLFDRRNLATGWLNNTKLCFYRSHIQYYKRYFSFRAWAVFGLWPPHSWGF